MRALTPLLAAAVNQNTASPQHSVLPAHHRRFGNANGYEALTLADGNGRHRSPLRHSRSRW
ncbi:Uncharacterised protein [Vibrio cholerae]|nr:Uncharacterised protein [Vibrio cholerae]